MAHANARLTTYARRLLVDRVLAGYRVADVAAQLGCSRTTPSLPPCGYRAAMPDRTRELTGVPYTSAREPGGIAEAITVLRSAGLAERLGALGVGDAGDLALLEPSGERGESGLLNEDALCRLVTAVRERVRKARRVGRILLLVGGDCPVIIGALAALRDAGGRPGLVMVDGHEDAWPPALSPTGEASDSEVAIALGLVDDLPALLGRITPLIDPSALAFLGPRDKREIESAGLESLSSRVAFFVDDRGLTEGEIAETRTREALAAIDAESLWLHVDLDVLSSEACPAVDYPQPGGIGWPTLDRIARRVLADRRCLGASIVIYNPDMDPTREVARDVASFVVRLASGSSDAGEGGR